MKTLTRLILILLCSFVLTRAETAPTTSPDSVKATIQNAYGLKADPLAKKPDAIFVRLSVDVDLNSREAATLRVAANLDGETQLTTVYIRSIKRGKDVLDVQINAGSFNRERLGLVVWLDENPKEEKSPIKPLAFEKLAIDVSKF